MRKIILFFVLMWSIITSACSQNESIKLNMEDYSYQESYNLRKSVADATYLIFTTAFDGENIDIEEAFNIIHQYQPKSFSFKTKSDDVDEDELNQEELEWMSEILDILNNPEGIAWENYFDASQMVVVNSLFNMASSGQIDYNYALNLASNIADEDLRTEICEIVQIIRDVHLGITDATSELGSRWKRILGVATCDIATGALATIYASWGGGIICSVGMFAAAPSAFITAASIIGGVVLSMIFCDVEDDVEDAEAEPEGENAGVEPDEPGGIEP